MDFSIGMYMVLFSAHLIQVSLVLAIFTSIYMKSRIKGTVCLFIIGFLFTYQIYKGFTASTVMGMGLLIIILSMLLVTIFVVRRKKESAAG
jgi:hypothetical protein